MLSLWEVAELAGIHPLQYQFEEPRTDAGPSCEGMAQGTDGEQHKPYNRGQGHHHQPVRPGALQAEQVGEANRRYPSEYKDGPEDSGYALLRGDQARPPGIGQPPHLAQSFSVELFLSLRVWLEPVYGRPEVVDKVPSCRRPRLLLQHGLLALRHQGPLLVDHLFGISFGELLDVGALWFGQLIAQPEDLGSRVGLLFHRLARGLVLFPHGDHHEREEHSVDHAQGRIDEACNVVVLLARSGWHEAMHQFEPHERDQAYCPDRK